MKRCKKWDHLWVPETFKHCFPERGGLKSIRPLEICLKVHPFMQVQASFNGCCSFDQERDKKQPLGENQFSRFTAAAAGCANIEFIKFEHQHQIQSPDNPDKKNHPLCPPRPRTGVKAQWVTNGLVPTTNSLSEQFIWKQEEKTTNGIDENAESFDNINTIRLGSLLIFSQSYVIKGLSKV